MAAQFSAGSLLATVKTIKGVSTISEGRAAREALIVAGKMLRAAVKANISLTDHTLKDLAALGHPYARRHGSIQIHTGGGSRLISVPTSVVHRQSGRLAASLKGHTSGKNHYAIELQTSIAPHARFIVEGTKVMLPRDPLWDTATDPRMKRMMMTAIVKRLGKELRSKTSVNFGSLSSRPTTPTAI